MRAQIDDQVAWDEVLDEDQSTRERMTDVSARWTDIYDRWSEIEDLLDS